MEDTEGKAVQRGIEILKTGLGAGGKYAKFQGIPEDKVEVTDEAAGILGQSARGIMNVETGSKLYVKISKQDWTDAVGERWVYINIVPTGRKVSGVASIIPGTRLERARRKGVEGQYGFFEMMTNEWDEKFGEEVHVKGLNIPWRELSTVEINFVIDEFFGLIEAEGSYGIRPPRRLELDFFFSPRSLDIKYHRVVNYKKGD